MTPAEKSVDFPQRKAVRRGGYETAFLPAALEVMETPPSPTGRAIAASILAFFCLAIGWAVWGSVDIVATAPGKIIPSGRTKIIQPFETGVVSAIHVKDGQSVKTGEVLIELDPAMNEADVEHSKAELLQKQAERDTIAATIRKLEATIPVLEQKVSVRKYLYDKALGSKLVYLTDYHELVGEQYDLVIQKNRYREADAAVAAAAQAVVKAERRTKLQMLISPVDGVVQQLAVHTVGGVVTPAQSLLVVVPVDTYLEIEAAVSNRDIGFVRVGQEAEIKVDTFNFTRYGLLHGHVLSISRDAIARDQPQDRSGNKAPGPESSPGEPKGQELVYAARVSLDRTQMQVEGNLVNISPGMAVTVEIKTGSRKIISYLLSPLVRHRQEVLRER